MNIKGDNKPVPGPAGHNNKTKWQGKTKIN